MTFTVEFHDGAEAHVRVSADLYEVTILGETVDVARPVSLDQALAMACEVHEHYYGEPK